MPVNINAVRDEIAALYAEATKHEETYSKADTEVPADEQAKQDERFSKMEHLKRSLDNAERLAKFAFSKEEPVAARVELPRKSADQVAVEQFSGADESREGYAAALSAFVRDGEVPDAYAALTTSNSTVLVPTIVNKPTTIIKLNPIRQAMAALGYSAESHGTTANYNSPVITPNAGGAFTEGVYNSLAAENEPSIGNIPLNVSGFHSGPVWFSNQLIAAPGFDMTREILPALQASRDYGLGKAIFAAIKADAAITQKTTTATTSTIVLGNLDNLNQLLPIPWDNNKAIILNQDVYNLAEKLTDSSGLPILQRNDIQGLHFLSYKGTPVFKTDALNSMGTTGNVVGVVISFNGFKLRDELEKLVRFENSPFFLDQTGLDNIAYHAWGYVPAALGLMIN